MRRASVAGDEVDVALAVALLLVGEAVELLRQRPQRLGEQPQLARLDRQLAGLGLEERALAPTMSPRSQCLNASCASAPVDVVGDVELDAARSCPAASRSTPCPSRASASCGRRRRRGSPSARAPRWSWRVVGACRSAASCSRRKSFGKACPCARSAASLARRSAMIWFSSCGGWASSFLLHRALFVSAVSARTDALLQAGGDEIVEVAVEHRLGVADLDVGAQVLDARLVEHVGADLVAPADVGLGVLELLLRLVPLAQLELVELRLQHRHRLGAVAVLRAVVLALHDDVGRQVRDAHRRVGLVDVLAAGARGAVGVDRAGRPD